MPSPDFSNYIDLTINDLQPGDIYDAAVEYARTALPEFAPRAGTVEDAVIQATAYIAGTTVGSINRLPDGLMEGVLKFMDILRNEATFGSASIEFTLGSAGDIVPAGTIAVFETTDGDVRIQYPFELTSELIAEVGETTVVGIATSQVAGILPSIPSGTTLILSQPSAVVLSATTTGAITQGGRPETQTEYFNRATSKLESLSSVLTTAKQVENYILTTYSEVHRCKVYDLTEAIVYEAASGSQNASRSGTSVTVMTDNDFVADMNGLTVGTETLLRIVSPSLSGSTVFETLLPSGHYNGASSGSSSVAYTDVISASGSYGPIDVIAMESIELTNIGGNPGFFVIFLCDRDGLPVSDSYKTTIYNDVNDRIVAGLSFKILDAFPVDLTFTVTISVDEEFGASSVATDVSTELESYMSLAGWPNWESTLRIFDIVVRANRVPGVSYVYSVVGDISEYADGAMYGNQNLVSILTDGGNTIGYSFLYAGVMPRASVEVVVI
jgi:hypothetical protein